MFLKPRYLSIILCCSKRTRPLCYEGYESLKTGCPVKRRLLEQRATPRKGWQQRAIRQVALTSTGEVRFSLFSRDLESSSYHLLLSSDLVYMYSCNICVLWFSGHNLCSNFSYCCHNCFKSKHLFICLYLFSAPF